MERSGIIVYEKEIQDAYNEYLTKKLDYIFNKNKKNKDNTMAWSFIKRRCVGEPKYKEGIAKLRLKDSDECIYINPNNELLGGRIFKNSEEDFHFGLKLVEDNGKYNYIDKNGELISDNWHRVAYNFHGDYAIVADDKFYFINRKGEKVSEEYDSIDKEATGGLYKAYRDYIKYNDYGKYYFLKPDGQPVNDEVYDWAYKFFYGYCQVLKNNKIGYINQKGELYNDKYISKNKANNSKHEPPKIQFGFISSFVDDVALANPNNNDSLWIYIDKNGNPLFDKKFSYGDYFNEGFAVVCENGYQPSIIRKDGKIIYKSDYGHIHDFKNGHAVVNHGDSYILIDSEGKIIGKKPFYDVLEDLSYSRFVKVALDDNKTINFVDGHGNFVLKENIIEQNFKVSITEISKNVIRIWYRKHFPLFEKDKLQYDQYLGPFEGINYKQVFRENGRTYYDLVTEYDILAIYDEYILCIKDEDIFMFDVKESKYTHLGTIYEIEYDKDFVFNGLNNKMYFMYSGMMIDITDYYEKKLLFKKKIGVRNKCPLYTYEVFRKNYIDNKIKELEEDMLTNVDSEKTPKRSFDELKDENNRLVNDLEKNIQKDEISTDFEYTSDDILKEKLAKLDEYEKKYGEIERFKVRDIFIYRGTYKEIKPIYLEKNLLRRIDLSNQDFRNAKMSGVDFRGCNIFFNPQEIYERDLSGCNFEGMYIPPFMNFIGVNLKGAKFSSDNDPYTKDYGSSYFPLAIYDETTTFDGIPFTVKYGECKYQEKDNNRRV